MAKNMPKFLKRVC